MKTIRNFLLFVVTALLAVTLSAQPGLAQEQVTCESDVMVQPGDSLSAIAGQVYGDPALYEGIVTATNQMAQTDSSYATISDPNVIVAGWKLCVPAQAGAEVAAASAATGTLTASQLANATYSGIYEEPVTLTEGLYEGEPFAAKATKPAKLTPCNMACWPKSPAEMCRWRKYLPPIWTAPPGPCWN